MWFSEMDLKRVYRTADPSWSGEVGKTSSVAVHALPTLPFITSSVTASPLEEGGDHTDSVTGPSLRFMAASARFVVLSDSSHHSATNSAGPEVDSDDVGEDKSVPAIRLFFVILVHMRRRIVTLSLFTGKVNEARGAKDTLG
ncbi:hypothetical protein Tco_0236198 [Tanacetum coccineum]